MGRIPPPPPPLKVLGGSFEKHYGVPPVLTGAFEYERLPGYFVPQSHAADSGSLDDVLVEDRLDRMLEVEERWFNRLSRQRRVRTIIGYAIGAAFIAQLAWGLLT